MIEGTYSPLLPLPLPGLAIKPRIPASCVKLDVLPRAPEVAIMLIGFFLGKLAINSPTISSFTSAHSLLR